MSHSTGYILWKKGIFHFMMHRNKLFLSTKKIYKPLLFSIVDANYSTVLEGLFKSQKRQIVQFCIIITINEG